jgi:hypothetical protein
LPHDIDLLDSGAVVRRPKLSRFNVVQFVHRNIAIWTQKACQTAVEHARGSHQAPAVEAIPGLIPGSSPGTGMTPGGSTSRSMPVGIICVHPVYLWLKSLSSFADSSAASLSQETVPPPIGDKLPA